MVVVLISLPLLAMQCSLTKTPAKFTLGERVTILTGEEGFIEDIIPGFNGNKARYKVRFHYYFDGHAIINEEFLTPKN